MFRRVSAVLLAALSSVVVLSSSAVAGPGEGEFVSRTNGARAANGRAAYAVRSDLASVARRHAARMAAQGRIWHNGNLQNEVANWRAVGENVGMGGSVSAIHSAFMNSSAHRSNILDRDFTEVGIGTAVGGDGTIYVAEVFRQPMSSSTVRPPAPQPAPRPVVRTPVTRRASAPVVRRSTAPAPRPVVKARPVDPAAAAAALRARLQAAATAAAKTGATGAVPRAVSYLQVMETLSR